MNRIQLIFNEKWAMAREDYYNLVSLILPSIHSGNFKEVEAFFEKDTVTAVFLPIRLPLLCWKGRSMPGRRSAFRNILHRRQLMTVLQASFCG